MNDEEIEIDQEYLDAYNGGYNLYNADKALAEEYLRRLKDKPEKFTERDKGMKDGILQGRIEEKQRELDDIFAEKDKRKRGLSR